MDPREPIDTKQDRAPQPPEDSARRQFLGRLLKLSGGAMALLAVPPPAEGSAEARTAKGPGDGYDWSEHRYAYLIDTAKCIGCGSCARACAAENKVPDGFFRTWIERYVVSMEESHIDSPNGGKDGFPPIQVGFAATKHFFVPKMCNHCAESPCTQVCPVGASYLTKDGAVLVDSERCIGCAYCVQACPYGSRFINPATHTADKCTWCYHRTTKGLRPACVDACPTGTRAFGDLKNENDPVRKVIERERVSILQGHLHTEPHCFYLNLDREVR